MKMMEGQCVRSEEPIGYKTNAPIGALKAETMGVRGRLDHLIELSETMSEEANSNWTPIKAIENIITLPGPQDTCEASAENPEPEASSINGKIDRIQKLLEQAIKSTRMQHERLNKIAQTKL